MVLRKLGMFCAVVALGAVAAPAFADIYMHKDERGVVHFTNIPQGDKRFKLVRKEAGTSAYTAAAGQPQYALPREEMIRRFSSIIETASRTHNVEPALVHAVITAESGYNPGAVSPVGARGLMQLMPGTATRFGVQNIMDPSENIHGGVQVPARTADDVQRQQGTRRRRVQRRGKCRHSPRQPHSRRTPKPSTTCRKCSASTRNSSRARASPAHPEYWAQVRVERRGPVPDTFSGPLMGPKAAGSMHRPRPHPRPPRRWHPSRTTSAACACPRRTGMVNTCHAAFAVPDHSPIFTPST